ncbi:hypothetical protein WJX82_001222 [Trebouxia sp. C0006]
MAVDRSPFAAPAQSSERSLTDGVNSGEAMQPSRAASPGSLPQTLSRPPSGSAFRSPASWFNRTTSSTTGSNPKHSLLAMVPSQPLSRPTASAPPSPASHLQPPTIPALDDLKQTEELSTLAAAPLMRKLADISADVELLNHEVTRIRYEQSTAVLEEEQRDLSEQEEQQLELLHQKRSADLVLRQCATCLKSVTAHKWAFPFAKPVDINLFKDYPNIIAKPMDFATIKANMEGGVYKEPQQFYDGMKLVFNNARRYNPPGSDVNLMASGVEEKFEERWQALLAPKLAEEQTHTRTDAAAVRKQRLDCAQARLAAELEQHWVSLLSVFDNLHSHIMDAKTLAAAACKPVSQQDKEALLPALEALSPDQFEWAMSLVHARYPGLPTGPGEEMQFDITCLDSLALRQLMDLTQACARAAKMAEGGEVQVTWPANPVGVGSRGHKPASSKRARRSPTPPIPLSAHATASAPPIFSAAPHSVPVSAQPSQGIHQLVADVQTVRQPQVESVRPEHVTQPAGPVPADSVAQQSSQAVTAPVIHEPTRTAPLQPAAQPQLHVGAGPSAAAQQACSAQANHAATALLSRQGAAANAADGQTVTQPIVGAGGFPSEAMDIDSHGLEDAEAAARAAESQPQHSSSPMPDNAQQQLANQALPSQALPSQPPSQAFPSRALPSQPPHQTTSFSQPAVSPVKEHARFCEMWSRIGADVTFEGVDFR